MMHLKNILIICWDFPPNTAIGGRRWAKIAKSFIKLGYSVSVISKNPGSLLHGTPWIEKDYLSQIESFYLEQNKYSQWLNDYTSKWKFFKVRLARFLLSMLYKGTVYDKAIGIEKEYLSLSKSVIKIKGIDTIFVTGAPFNLIYYTSKLKRQFPEINIIADYRDPWLQAQNLGMQGLSNRNKMAEQNKQNFVFENVDYISAPNHFLLEEIKQTYTGVLKIKAKFITLPHAFDPDDILSKVVEKSSSLKIVYGGSLYMGIDSFLEFLNKSIYIAKNKLNRTLEIKFYTNEVQKIGFFKENVDVVKMLPSIGEKIFNEINTCDYVLILLAEHNKNYTTTKFYEYLPYNKPYIYLGPDGFVSEKIVNEKLGFVLRNEEDLSDLLIELDTQTKVERDIDAYTFDKTVVNFLEMLS